MKRRNFLGLLSLAIVPKTLASNKPEEKKMTVSPTHLIKVKPVTNPKSPSYSFPCALEIINTTKEKLEIGCIRKMHYINSDKTEDYVVTEIRKLEPGIYMQETN